MNPEDKCVMWKQVRASESELLVASSPATAHLEQLRGRGAAGPGGWKPFGLLQREGRLGEEPC